MLLEIRLHGWMPAAIDLMGQVSGLLRHALQGSHAVDMDLSIEYARRQELAERMRKAQAQVVDGLTTLFH